MYKYEQYKRCSRATKGKLESRAGGLEGWGLDSLPMIHTTALLFWSAIGRIHKLQTVGSGHKDPGESETSQRVVW